jgi:hypothetical protein
VRALQNMKKSKLTKDQLQKLMLSAMGFVVLVYVYFAFFLGPLNRSRAQMLAKMNELQEKIGSSKSEMNKASKLEQQAGTATSRFDVFKNLSPEGAPIAWFPPRMKLFFSNYNIEKVTARLDSSSPFKDPELAAWMRYNWVIEMPQTDFVTVGNAVAALENGEPLLALTHVNIKALADAPQFQQVTFSVSTTLAKR